MALPPTIIPVLIAARQARIVRKFGEAGADQPERARTLAELGVRDTHLVSRFARSGVLVTADGVRYFLSADGLARSGVPFHQAHQLVGRLVLESLRRGKKPSDWTAAELAAFAPEFRDEMARLLRGQ